MKTVFWLGIMFIMQISRLRFKQSRISAAARPRYLCFGLFHNVQKNECERVAIDGMLA